MNTFLNLHQFGVGTIPTFVAGWCLAAAPPRLEKQPRVLTKSQDHFRTDFGHLQRTNYVIAWSSFGESYISHII